MRARGSPWLWNGIWAIGLLIGVGLFVLYTWLPADGATGDLESFSQEGFRVQWLLERRRDGLRIGDVIVRAGGQTVDEWLEGARRGPEWRSGGVVTYEILRDGQPIALQIPLAPIPFDAVMKHWGWQLLVSFGFLVIGAFVFWKRPQELAARLLMLFCVAMMLQYWGDAYNFQYATLPWRWPFWFQLTFEHLMYSLSVATMCYFALVFPIPHPLVQRYPRLVPFVTYAAHPAAILGALAIAENWSTALTYSNRASWAVALSQIGLAIAVGVRSLRTAPDPVTRSQVRWILWCAGVGVTILIPGYVLALVLTGRPLLRHPVTMLGIALIPFSLAIAILRYRLFDIEIIINRTLVYGTLTVLLGGLYLSMVRVLTLLVQRVSGRENDTLVVFIATMSSALAFAPLRSRVQAFIDRAFYRTKVDLQYLLPEMSERLATSIVIDQLVKILTAELPHRLQIAWSSLAIPDPAGEYFVSVGDENENFSVPADHPLIVYIDNRGQPLLRLQPPSDVPPAAQSLLDRFEIELCVPLVVGKRLVGLYSLGPKSSGDPYTRYELRLLRLLGHQAAVALENSRLLHAEREQRRLAEALQEATEVVSSTLNLDQVLDRILEQVEKVVAGDAFNIMLVKDGTAGVVRWRGYERLGVADKIANITLSISNHPTLTEMLRTRSPVVIPDTAANSGWVSRVGWEWLRSYVSAPIQVAGQVVGFLNVDGSEPNQFAAADAKRLEVFAQQAAVAFDHARLYAQARQEIAERKSAEARIKVSLKEKEVLLKEIHHRVKNNLQVVSSLLYLQSRAVEDEKTIGAIQESRDRVKSMALIHETLYRAEDLVRVDFESYVRSLVNHLFISYGCTPNRIKLSIAVKNVSLGIDAAIPCGLILNELISNALKHAFPGERMGRINVEFCMDDDDRYALAVRDDGAGIPEGLDPRNAQSLGLQLVSTLVDQLDGNIQLDRSGGTGFRITFTEQVV